MKDTDSLFASLMDVLDESEKSFVDAHGVDLGFMNRSLLRLTIARETAFIETNCASLLAGLVCPVPGRITAINECSFTFNHIILEVTLKSDEGNSGHYRAILTWSSYAKWRSLPGKATASTDNDNTTH